MLGHWTGRDVFLTGADSTTEDDLVLLADLRSVQVLLLSVRRPSSVLASGGSTTRLRLRLRLASQRRIDTAKGGRRRSSSRTSRTGRVGLGGHLRRRERERTLTRRRRRRRDKVRRERKRRHRQSPLRRDRVATGDSAGTVGAVVGRGRCIVTRSGGGVLHPTRRDVHLGGVSEVRRRGRGEVVRLERGGRVLTSMSVGRFRRVLRRSLARSSSASCSSSAELHPAHSVREVLFGRVRRGGARLSERSVHAFVRRTTRAGALERVRISRLGRRGHRGHKVRVAERRRRRVGRLIRVQVRARLGTRNRFRRGGVHRRRGCRRRQTTETGRSRTVVGGRGSRGRRAQVVSVVRRRRAVRRRIGGGACTATVTTIASVFGGRRVCRDWQETRASRSAQRWVGHRGGRGGGRAQLHGGS